MYLKLPVIRKLAGLLLYIYYAHGIAVQFQPLSHPIPHPIAIAIFSFLVSAFRKVSDRKFPAFPIILRIQD